MRAKYSHGAEEQRCFVRLTSTTLGSSTLACFCITKTPICRGEAAKRVGDICTVRRRSSAIITPNRVVWDHRYFATTPNEIDFLSPLEMLRFASLHSVWLENSGIVFE